MLNNEEQSKNLKAIGFTTITCLALAGILLLVSWTFQPPPQPTVDNGIEVNLGNSDQGFGDIAPQLPGEPSNETKENNNPPPTVASHDEPSTSKDVADNNDNDVPIIKTSSKPKTIKKENKKAIQKSIVKKTESHTINKTPAPPTPKAVYKGGTNKGTGGNNADSYNGIRNQGIAGGQGDQGKPNGDPNSNNYNGNGGTGTGGISIHSGLGGRRFVGGTVFQDKFNENAKVAVDIVVNASGHVTSASINPRGTTTTNGNILSIAKRKASQLKFNKSDVQTQTGTIVFNFKLKG